jgi:hypothetical protein
MERSGQSRTNFGRVRLALPDSSSGQVSGDFKIGKPPVNHLCVAECSEQYPPIFPEKISCLAGFPGETDDEGAIQALMARQEVGKSRAGPERFVGEIQARSQIRE